MSSSAGGGDTAAAAMSLLLLYRLVDTGAAAPIGFSARSHQRYDQYFEVGHRAAINGCVGLLDQWPRLGGLAVRVAAAAGFPLILGPGRIVVCFVVSVRG